MVPDPDSNDEFGDVVVFDVGIVPGTSTVVLNTFKPFSSLEGDFDPNGDCRRQQSVVEAGAAVTPAPRELPALIAVSVGVGVVADDRQ